MSSPDKSGTPEKLVYMANQIATFFASQDQATAPEKTAEHIKKFWDPRMRKDILAQLDAGGAGFSPNVRAAVESLRPAAAARSAG
jgi:formate dehydrogenase subunit delta